MACREHYSIRSGRGYTRSCETAVDNTEDQPARRAGASTNKSDLLPRMIRGPGGLGTKLLLEDVRLAYGACVCSIMTSTRLKKVYIREVK